MSEEWGQLALENVCSLITDGSHFSPPTVPEGIPYVTVRDVRDGQVDLSGAQRIAPASFEELARNGCQPFPGDALFSKDGTVGRVALVTTESPFVVLSSLAILRPDRDRVLPAFLSCALQSPQFQEAATGQKTGLAIKRVVLKNLKRMVIPVPPLSVQRRIVDLMAHLDNHLANLRAERACAQDVEEGSLAALVSQFEESGKSQPLSEYAEVFDCEHKTAPACDDSEAFGLSVGTRDIRNGFILPERAKRVSEATWQAWSRRVQVRHQDILMAREAPVGPLAVVTPDLPPLCLGQRTVLIRPRAGVNSDVLSGFLRSPNMQAWMRSKSAGLTVAHLNVADIKQIPVPQLPDESRQKVLGGAVVSMLNYRHHLSEEISRVECIRSALLGSLMNRQSEIPDSYDSLLPEAA